MEHDHIKVSDCVAADLAASDDPRVELVTPDGRTLGWFVPAKFLDGDKPYIVAGGDSGGPHS